MMTKYLDGRTICLINERLEAETYLRGENINKRCVYRMCYLIAKYYLEHGVDALETRERIFDWLKRNNIYISSSLSGIVYKASVDGVVLRGETPIYISENDVEEIRRRFDTKNTRMLALALLCYGKAAADRNGECAFSALAMSNWISMDNSSMLKRYMPQMYTFSFVEKVKPKYKWDKDQKDKMTHIKFSIPLENSGQYKLDGNNIAELFSRIFDI